MSWSSGNTFPKKNGLIIGESAAAPPSPFTLRPTFAAMEFDAVYAADFPGLAEMGGTFDAGTAGVNAVLADGDLSVTFTGTGAAQGTVDIGSGAGPIAFEILVNATLTAVGLRSQFIFGFDGNQNYGGIDAISQFLNADGTINGFDPQAPIAPLVAGDVVGIVIDASSTAYAFYVNGVAAFAGGLGAAGNPYTACVSAA